MFWAQEEQSDSQRYVQILIQSGDDDPEDDDQESNIISHPVHDHTVNEKTCAFRIILRRSFKNLHGNLSNFSSS